MLTLVGALMATANPALAQTPVPVTATADPNVTPYAPAFFAEFRPVTALDGSLQLNMGGNDNGGSRIRTAPDGSPLLLARRDGAFDHRSAQATTVYEGPLGGGRIRANVLMSYGAGAYESLDVLALPFGVEHSLGDDRETKIEGDLRWTRSLPMGMNLELVGFRQIKQENGSNTYDTPFFTSDTLSESTSGESI